MANKRCLHLPLRLSELKFLHGLISCNAVPKKRAGMKLTMERKLTTAMNEWHNRRDQNVTETGQNPAQSVTDRQNSGGGDS